MSRISGPRLTPSPMIESARSARSWESAMNRCRPGGAQCALAGTVVAWDVDASPPNSVVPEWNAAHANQNV